MSDAFQITSINTPAIAIYPPGATFGPRELVDYEFVWMMEGNAHYMCNGESVRAPEGSFVLCRPGVNDAFLWDTKRRTRHAYCHFSMETTPSFFSLEWPILRSSAEVRVLEPAFQYLLTLAPSKEYFRLESALSLLVVAFVTTPETRMVRDSVLPDSVELVLTYIRERLDGEPEAKITLAELAKIGYCSKEHLCRVFQSAIGLTPAECVRLSKLDRAATMLARSNYSISEISLQYGFSNPSHFTKRFLEEYGASPREFRQMLRQGGKVPASRLLR